MWTHKALLTWQSYRNAPLLGLVRNVSYRPLTDLKEKIENFLIPSKRNKDTEEESFSHVVFVSGDNGVGKSILFGQLLGYIIKKFKNVLNLLRSSSEYLKFKHALSHMPDEENFKTKKVHICVGVSELFGEHLSY